jgi:Raf kinase inhibitor-like YbhB/YbcL family protein
MSLKLGNLKITSPAFAPLGRIPKRNAGDGDNLSPALEWTGAPKGTRQFALLCFDFDAPLPRGFVHWVVYGIPATATRLSEGQAPGAFTAGINGTGKTGYMGPYPPNGHGVHHYYFWVYALDRELSLKPGLDMWQVLDAIAPHILEQARTVGLYER